MKRRLMFAPVGALLGMPFIARAQEAGRTYRLGALSYVSKQSDPAKALLGELRALGFVDGKNLAVDERGYNKPADQMPAAAREMVAAKVDVIVCQSAGPSIRAAQAATTTIPIVGISDDMLQEGLVGSLSRHGGNTTGISILASELDGKRQELLMEMVPGANRMAVVADSAIQTPAQLGVLQAAARASGRELSVRRVDKPDEVPPALDAAKAEGAQAVNILASPLFQGTREAIFSKARALGLPIIFQWPESVHDGATIAYGPDRADSFRQLGRMVAKVLRGARPGDLPIEQPTVFKLAINMKVARELGIAVPPPLLARADEVVE
jgi:putative ABC transport system substrate-binding protein